MNALFALVGGRSNALDHSRDGDGTRLTSLPRGLARLARRAASPPPFARRGGLAAAASADELTITTPDDWHLHVRDASKIASVVPFTARAFGRALIMPNLVPPVRTVQDAAAYRAQILAAVPEGVAFEPQMTLYLTDNTSAADIEAAAASGFVRGCKLYPAGATTNSDFGVTDVSKITGALEAMAACGLVLEVHGEVTHASVDVFDRERVFLDETLRGLCEGPRAVKGLKIVMEHITTGEAVAFCESQGENVAATITPQHILYNRNAMLVGGIRPHLYCLPILKREKHREASPRGDERQPQVFPRDGFGAAPARRQAGVRVRGRLFRARGVALYAPRSKKKANWKNWRVRVVPRRRLLRRRAQRRDDDAAKSAVDRAGGRRVRRRRGAVLRGRNRGLGSGGRMSVIIRFAVRARVV